MTDSRPAPGRPVPPTAFLLLGGGVAVLVLIVVVALAVVVLRQLSPGGSDRVAATLGVTLTRTATGTDVTLVITAAGPDRLADQLELQFTPVDQGINDDGGPLTSATIRYDRARDGAGEELSVADPPATIKDVNTDGRRATLSFTVASAAGRRVIYPMPYSPAVRFNAISVTGGGSTSCLQSSGSENGRLHYFTCTIDPSGQVRYSGGSWAPESIRLELAG